MTEFKKNQMLSAFTTRFSACGAPARAPTGLQIHEPLLKELSVPGLSGVTFTSEQEALVAEHSSKFTGGLSGPDAFGLPELSEPMVMRHFHRLSHKNYSLEHGMYPLGSCTMKYNPRVNEAAAKIPGFAHSHPLQPVKTVQGSLELIQRLSQSLLELLGMEAITLAPSGGSDGEHTGLMAIKAAQEARGETHRDMIIMPESAHGTNPASAAMCGFETYVVPCSEDGSVDMSALREALATGRIAGMMLTNPNTVGMFERDIEEITRLLHDNGAFFYMDGANMNALLGRVRPGDFGVDAMHLNLHKSFSTPHGGGGPGSGPVVFSEALAPYAPRPRVVEGADGFALDGETAPTGTDLGRVRAFMAQFGILVRAYAYILSLGGEGLRNVSGDAVLNANYLLARLRELTPAIPGRTCMHEFALSDRHLEGTGVSTMDLAKALCDRGFHPPTVYFPLFVSGAMLIEPTESESLASLDAFADALIGLAADARGDAADALHAAPVATPVRRCDEVGAAKKPVLRW